MNGMLDRLALTNPHPPRLDDPQPMLGPLRLSASSNTVSHSQPAVRRTSADSIGMFSSTLPRIRRLWAGSGNTRSCASSAAYANAA